MATKPTTKEKASAAKKTTTKKPAKKATIPTGSLSLKEVIAMFGVGHMTVYNWRKGGGRKTTLPSHTVPNGERELVYFKPHEVKSWAKKNDVQIVG